MIELAAHDRPIGIGYPREQDGHDDDVPDDDGLVVGTQLQLMRDAESVATVEVKEVSARRAVATVLTQTTVPRVGDRATFTAARTTTVAEPAADPPQVRAAVFAGADARRIGRRATQGWG